MITTYARKSDGAIVQAMRFTGEGRNRNDTKIFMGRMIIIREGQFFDGTGYVVSGDWLVKFGDTVTKYTDAEFNDLFEDDL
jgi:hypothetical protein